MKKSKEEEVELASAEVVENEAAGAEVVKADELQNEKLTAKSKLVLCLCGALIGFINGFFGGGGGMICVPLLERVLHLPNKYSHATAIVVILPISFISACVYLLSGNLQSIPLVTVGAGVVLGGVIGSFLLKFLPAKAVRVIFALVMLAGGIKLLL